MSRQARQTEEYLHIIVRGLGKQVLFEDDSDRLRFLSFLHFKRIDFDTFKEDAGSNAYVFSIKKWNEELGGVGIITKSGRYGGGI